MRATSSGRRSTCSPITKNVARAPAAASAVALSDTQRLGRLVRWRIPGLARGLSYDDLFRHPPFIVLEEDECALVSGLVGRIWTLRRDYPRLGSAQEFAEWSRGGTAR